MRIEGVERLIIHMVPHTLYLCLLWNCMKILSARLLHKLYAFVHFYDTRSLEVWADHRVWLHEAPAGREGTATEKSQRGRRSRILGREGPEIAVELGDEVLFGHLIGNWWPRHVARGQSG